MPARRGLLAPQNTFLDTIATRFDGTHSNFVLGNAKIANVYPIVYCSDGFCELTGYSRAQIMQKSCACNFLYGQKTDVQNRESISRALEQKQELKLEVIMYKSSGTPFWCLLDIVPIQDEKHEVVLFLCSHKDITKQKLHEQHAKQQQHLHQLHLQQQQLQLQQQQAHAHPQADGPHAPDTQPSCDKQQAQQPQAANGPPDKANNSHSSIGALILGPRDEGAGGGPGAERLALAIGATGSLLEHVPQCHGAANQAGARADQQQQMNISADKQMDWSSQSQLDNKQVEQPRLATLAENNNINQANAHHHHADQSPIVQSSSNLLLHEQQQHSENNNNENSLLTNLDEFGLTNQDLDGRGLMDEMDELEFECPDSASDSEDHDKHTANLYSRRRSRAVLYQLSGHYGQRRSVNMKSKLKLNNRMNIPEYKTTTIEKQRFILLHYGLLKTIWDWIILIVTFYVAIVVPYNATFKPKQSEQTINSPTINFTSNSTTSGNSTQTGNNNSDECKVDTMDMIVEAIFLIDVCLNLRTTYVNRKGEVVTKPKTIMRHYLRTWFIVDTCAALPIDVLCGRFQSRVDLNLVKLIRLLRLARLLQKMDRYSQYSYIILTMLMLIFSLLAHWCACIWYVIAISEIDNNPPEWRIGWLHQLSDKLGYSVVNATDMASSYVTALYFTTSSLTSVGFGNVSANTNTEKIFSIVIMLIGALMHAVVFGNVTALIRVMYARRSNYQTRLRDLKDFFRLHQVPKELQQRMNDYFQTTWSLNHGIETYEILKDFPEELRGDVSLHLHREVLSLPIFETAPQGFLKSLARHIESKFCCPTEYLIHRGDALNYLYLVCNGSMEVLQDNMVVAILGKGDLVGYDVSASLVKIMNHNHLDQFGGGTVNLASSSKATSLQLSQLVKSSSDLKALTYCDLKCIQIAGLLETLKLYPEFSDTFHDEIIHDLSFNLRQEEAGHEETDEGGQEGEPILETTTTDDDERAPRNGRQDSNINANPNNNNGNNNSSNNQQQHCSTPLSGSLIQPRPGSPPPHFDHLYNSMGGGQSKTIRLLPRRPSRYKELDDDDDDEDDDEDEDDEGAAAEDDEVEEQEDDADDEPNSIIETDQEEEDQERGRDGDRDKPWPNDDDQQQQQRDQPADSVAGNPSAGSGPATSGQATGGPREVMSTEPNNNNDNVGAAASGQAAALPSSLRGKGAGSSRATGVKKPPLSFDLSRNTMAIVDRRRRSAGCIMKPPVGFLQQASLAGPACSGSGPTRPRRLRGHSSLMQINAPTTSNMMMSNQMRGINLAPGPMSAPAQLQHEQAATNTKSGEQIFQSRAPIPKSGSCRSRSRRFRTENGRSSEACSLDDRIVGISSSLNEIRREMGHFHATLASLQDFLLKGGDRQLITRAGSLATAKQRQHYEISSDGSARSSNEASAGTGTGARNRGPSSRASSASLRSRALHQQRQKQQQHQADSFEQRKQVSASSSLASHNKVATNLGSVDCMTNNNTNNNGTKPAQPVVSSGGLGSILPALLPSLNRSQSSGSLLAKPQKRRSVGRWPSIPDETEELLHSDTAHGGETTVPAAASSHSVDLEPALGRMILRERRTPLSSRERSSQLADNQYQSGHEVSDSLTLGEDTQSLSSSMDSNMMSGTGAATAASQSTISISLDASSKQPPHRATKFKTRLDEGPAGGAGSHV